MEFPLEFNISKKKANDAWGRAQSFIAKYSSMKIQTVTEFIIQTFTPPETDYRFNRRFDFGYSVAKTPLGKKVQITVSCQKSSIAGSENLFESEKEMDAHLLAYYISTGELLPKFIMRGLNAE